MKMTKTEILQAIKCCTRMGTRREQQCCVECPYKQSTFCYQELIKDLKWYVINDISSFVEYLKQHPDGSIKNFEDTEKLFDYVETGHLKAKEFDFVGSQDDEN